MSSTQARQAPHAGTHQLGPSRVHRMGYGAMQLRRLVAQPAQAEAVLERAIELGVDHIDTAQFYENGFVNATLARVLARHPDLVISSKVGADPNPGGRTPLKLAQRPGQLRASVEDNLRSLGVERIAVVNLRRLDAGPGLRPEGDQLVDLDDQLATMIALRDEGKIGAIGLSGVDQAGIQRALPAGIACVSNAYSLVDRHAEDALALCRAQGIAWVPFFPLGGAHPGLPKVTEQAALIEIAAELAITPAQLGLAWLLAHAPNILLIPGTADLMHLEQNMAATSVRLDEQALSVLDAYQPVGAGAHTQP